jgi:quinol monooxygenase YgiN
MILLNLRLIPPKNRVDEVVHALRLQMGRTEVMPGCAACRLTRDLDEKNVIVYQEEWNSWPDVEKHIRSDRFGSLLELMEISSRTPQLSFSDVHETRGIDYVERLRQGNGRYQEH